MVRGGTSPLKYGGNCPRFMLRPIRPGMATHYHVWVRAGKVFTMRERVFDSRKTAHKAAVRLRLEVADRLVLQCEACPTSAPPRRRPPNWTRIAADLAAAIGADPRVVRTELAAAREAEDRRRTTSSARAGSRLAA